MKSIDEINRINLDMLVQETKSKTIEEVAKIANKNPTYLRQIKNKSIVKSNGKPAKMGRNLARSLEQAFNKPVNWMDTSHSEENKESVNKINTDNKLSKLEVDLLEQFNRIKSESTKIKLIGYVAGKADEERFANKSTGSYATSITNRKKANK